MKIYSIDLSRGCLIIIWTGLDIKIGIVQKVYEWSSCPFAKMIPRLENHFGKILAWSLIYFWTMPILIFSPVQIIMRHPLFAVWVQYIASNFLVFLIKLEVRCDPMKTVQKGHLLIHFAEYQSLLFDLIVLFQVLEIFHFQNFQVLVANFG